MFIKKFSTAIIIFIFLNNLSSQKNIILHINGKLGSEEFSLNKNVSNNLGYKFLFTRLDLLISGIKLHHDGITTELSDEYIFIRNGASMEVDLGNHNIERLDSFTFSVGVDSIRNHADPAQWHGSHALSPKDPDMHWGWAGGYRFIALEGKAGEDSQYSYEIHTLGDKLYKPTTIVTNGTVTEDKLHINIDADYSKAMEDIKFNKNIFKHGSGAENVTCIENFNKEIFKEGEFISSTKDLSKDGFLVYPTLTLDGEIHIQNVNTEYAAIKIVDPKGAIIFDKIMDETLTRIMLKQNGLYSIIISDKNNNVNIQRIIKI
jgi:hypothetical protein